MNASGAFGDDTVKLVNIRPSNTATGEKDLDMAKDAAKSLKDDHAAVGIISLFSSIGGAILEVTNTPEYSDTIQCNVSGTSPGLTGDDTTDTFYRTVADDNFQGSYIATMLQEKGWDSSVAVYHIDDGFGTGLNGVIAAGLSGVTSVSFTAEGYDVAAAETTAALDGLINGGHSAIVLIALKNEAPGIVDYITSSSYSGALVLSDGAKADAVFSEASNLQSWLGEAGNYIIGTEPDNYAGKNSAAFEAALTAASIEKNTYSSSAYDCAVAIGYSVLYADTRDAAGVKAGIAKFKEANRMPAMETEAGVGADEFKKGADAIVAGGMVNYEGASGQLMFTADGDRPTQGINVFEVNASFDGWADLE